MNKKSFTNHIYWQSFCQKQAWIGHLNLLFAVSLIDEDNNFLPTHVGQKYRVIRWQRNATDQNMVTVILKAEDLKRAEEFARSDDLREAMQKVGVVGKPDIYFLKGWEPILA